MLGFSRFYSLLIAGCGVLALVAAIFLIGRSAGVRSEQRRTDPKVAAICEAGGATWPEVDAKGRPLPRGKWGRACLSAIETLAKFRADAQAASNKALNDDAVEQARKTADAAARAQRDAQALGAARKRMEAEDATIKDDRVGGGWFARLNELGGLRQPAEGRAGGHVQGAQGPPAR